MDDTHLNFNHPASCSIEDAVLYLLDFKYEELQPKWDGNEWVDHPDYLLQEIEDAVAALSEAKFHKVSDELIKQKQVEYENAIARKKLAHEYQCAIVEELSSNMPKLLLDITATTPIPFITLVSLKRWAKEIYHKDILGDLLQIELVKQLSPNRTSIIEINDWDKHQEGDPEPEETWFPAARYFAREILKENPNIIFNKTQLSPLVAKRMYENNVRKDNNQTYEPGTVRKAFRNIKFTI